MTQYKLTYFDLRARGEPIRLLFAVAGQEFTDDRIQFERWPEVKPSVPFGQLPLLEIQEEGKTTILAQSKTIRELFFSYYMFHQRTRTIKYFFLFSSEISGTEIQPYRRPHGPAFGSCRHVH